MKAHAAPPKNHLRIQPQHQVAVVSRSTAERIYIERTRQVGCGEQAGCAARLLAERVAPRGFWSSVLRRVRHAYAAGARYVFILNALASADAEVAQLLAALKSGALLDDQRIAFGAHCRCVRVQCGQSLADIDALEQAQTITPQLLAEAWCQGFPSAHLAGKTLRLRWLSPARLLKPAPRPRAGEARFIAEKTGVDAAFLWRRLLTSLARFAGLQVEKVAPPLAQLSAVELFWHTQHDRGSNEAHNPIGGLLGDVCLLLSQDLALETLGMLLIAGHMGIGQRRQFGLGQFEVLPGNTDKKTLEKDVPEKKPKHGLKWLRNQFVNVQSELEVKLNSARGITHPTAKGDIHVVQTSVSKPGPIDWAVEIPAFQHSSNNFSQSPVILIGLLKLSNARLMAQCH